MTRWSVLALCLSALVVPACTRSTDQRSAEERPPVAVEVANVAPASVKESIEVVGTLAPKFSGDVKTEYSGTITDVFVTEWVHVTKGMLLARFDRREPEAMVKSATAARLQSEVARNRARRELERAEKLKAAGLATQQTLDDARTGADAADAQVNAAKAQEEMAQTRLAKTEVRAPIDGVIAARIVNPGNYIQNMGGDSTMFRIVDNRRLELTVSVPSTKISSVKLGQPLTFTTDAAPGRTFEGRVSYVKPAADEASRAVKVVAVVENADGALKSGLFAKGAIVTGERQNVLTVPRKAMLTWDPGNSAALVYVVEGDRAVRKSVTTGAATGDLIEISTGLTAGDNVVTRGAFNIREGDKVTVIKPVADGDSRMRGFADSRIRGCEDGGIRGFEGRGFEHPRSRRDCGLDCRIPSHPRILESSHPRSQVG